MTLVRLAARGRAVPSLLVNRPTSRSAIASTILGAPDDGLVTPPRTRRHGERWPSVLHLPADLYRPEDGIDGVVWLAACLSSEEGGLSHAARVERSAREAEANASARVETPSRRRERGSDARGRCSRVIDVVAEVDRQWLWRREADALHFTRSGSVQGRAPSSQLHARKCAAAGEETLAPSSQRKPHVTAFELGVTRAGRGPLAMEGIPDRRGRRLFTERPQSTV